MSHLDDGTLHALLDGEVSSAELPLLERHLAGCRDCQARLSEARNFREEAFGLIEVLDEPAMADASAAAAPVLVADLPPDRSGLRENAAPQYAVSASTSTPRLTGPGIRRAPDRVVPRWAPALAWAATIVVAVGLGYSWRDRLEPPATAPVAAEQAIADVASADSTLPDLSTSSAPSNPPAARSAAAVTQDSGSPAAANRQVAREERVSQPVASSQAAERASSKTVPASPRREVEPPAPDQIAAGPARARDTTRLLRASERMPALSELVVTGTAARSATIPADSAIRLLGGSLLLIEGWNPERYELADSTIRVVYATPYGEVALEQWRTDRAVGHQLVTPPRAPSDSVTAWRSRIR